MNEYFPTVVQVIPLDNFHVQVFFDCTVMNGTLAWDLSGNRDESGYIDIDPFAVYECHKKHKLFYTTQT